jgi:thiol-disulfide isomerase/thioredoxin
MKIFISLLFLLLFFQRQGKTQNHPTDSLNIGDAAPPLREQKWIKGTPIQHFEKGKVYVVDFWATWCRPCIASMPHLSSLAHKYKDKVIFLAIDIYEDKGPHPTRLLKQLISFVDSMGRRMDFPVAIDDNHFMANHWVEASGENSIPTDFVVNAQGKVAWIGNPADLDMVLQKVVNNTWDIKAALSKRHFNEHLAEMDDEADNQLHRYLRLDDSFEYYIAKPDSALIAINEMIKKVPQLKYAPNIASYTLWALLKTDQHNAYEYGKKVIETPTYQEPAYNIIIGKIEYLSKRLKFYRKFTS